MRSLNDFCLPLAGAVCLALSLSHANASECAASPDPATSSQQSVAGAAATATPGAERDRCTSAAKGGQKSIVWDVVARGGGQGSSEGTVLYDVIGQDVAPASGQINRVVLSDGFEAAPDSDGDVIRDFLDNCILTANPAQRDSDEDGFGNDCDGDLNNDNVVNFRDLALLRQCFGTATDTCDLNGDGKVDFADLELITAGFFSAPGPSGRAD